MKKSLLILCLGLSSMLVFTGCNSAETVVEEPVFQEEVVEEVVESVEEEPESPESSEEVSEAVSEESLAEEEAKGDSKLAALEVTQEFAQEKGLTCLKRDGKLYGLSGITPENCKKYNLGWIYLACPNVEGYSTGLLFPAEVGTLNHDMGQVYYEGEGRKLKGERYMTSGDLPEITLEAGDELLNFCDWGTLNVFSAEKVGYSPEIDFFGNGFGDYAYYDKSEPPLVFGLTNLKEFNLTDEDGNIVTTDVFDFSYSFGGEGDFNYAAATDSSHLVKFQYGEKYWVYCIQGFDEHKWSTSEADCTVYDVIGVNSGGLSEPAYQLQGSIDTVNKCYSFDYSELESGLYYIGNYLVNVE